MLRDSDGLPPEDHAFDTVDALVKRAKTLRQSANKLCGEDMRTAFFLATMAREETMEGYLMKS